MKYLRVKSVANKLDVSQATVWRFVQQEILPKPIKLSARTTVWRSEDIDAAIESIAANQSSFSKCEGEQL